MNRWPVWIYRLTLANVVVLVVWTTYCLSVVFLYAPNPVDLSNDAMAFSMLAMLALATSLGSISILTNVQTLADRTRSFRERGSDVAPVSAVRKWIWIRGWAAALALIVVSTRSINRHREEVSTKEKDLQAEARMRGIIQINHFLLDSLRVDSVTEEEYHKIGRAMRYIAQSNTGLKQASLIFSLKSRGTPILCELGAENVGEWQPIPPRRVRESCEKALAKGIYVPETDGKWYKQPCSTTVSIPNPLIDPMAFPANLTLEARRLIEASLQKSDEEATVEESAYYGPLVRIPITIHKVRCLIQGQMDK